MKGPRLLVTIPAVITAVVPLIADLNPSHQLNPGWPPHARYHGAVLLLTNVALGLLSLWLLWAGRGGPHERERLRIAAMLPAVIWGAFFPALLFPGTSTWPDGFDIPAGLPFAGNLVVAAVIVVLCVTALFKTRSASG
jgi:hypothetical protein